MERELVVRQFECMVTRREGHLSMLVAPWETSSALTNILDGLQDMRDDSALCQALSEHPDLIELAARIAAVQSLRSEIADRDITDAEYAMLNKLRADTCEWIRNEAEGALDDLANPLPDQVAAHDAEEDFHAELSTFEARGVSIEDHGRLNYIRSHAKGPDRARAGNLLIKLAGASKVVLWFPADRVLGEGERKICSEEWMYLRSLERYARKHGPESIQDVIGCLDHLRASQGGAAT